MGGFFRRYEYRKIVSWKLVYGLRYSHRGQQPILAESAKHSQAKIRCNSSFRE
jgi:hypothetical protein